MAAMTAERKYDDGAEIRFISENVSLLYLKSVAQALRQEKVKQIITEWPFLKASTVVLYGWAVTLLS